MKAKEAMRSLVRAGLTAQRQARKDTSDGIFDNAGNILRGRQLYSKIWGVLMRRKHMTYFAGLLAIGFTQPVIAHEHE